MFRFRLRTLIAMVALIALCMGVVTRVLWAPLAGGMIYFTTCKTDDWNSLVSSMDCKESNGWKIYAFQDRKPESIFNKVPGAVPFRGWIDLAEVTGVKGDRRVLHEGGSLWGPNPPTATSAIDDMFGISGRIQRSQVVPRWYSINCTADFYVNRTQLMEDGEEYTVGTTSWYPVSYSGILGGETLVFARPQDNESVRLLIFALE